jgi:molybdopterin converting factor small subunit
MNVRIQYTGQLRTATGRSSEEIDLPDSSTLASLLTHLASRLDRESHIHLLTPSGHPQPGLLIILNDAAIPPQNLSSTPLHPRDTITLLPPIAGG